MRRRLNGRDLPWSWQIAAGLLAFQGLLWWLTDAATMNEIYRRFGLSASGLNGGAVWQVFSYGVFHGSVAHLLINAIAMGMLGARVTRYGGTARMAVVFVLGVLGGAGMHLLLLPGEAAGRILVGSSGGVVALLFWITTVSPASRMMPIPVSGRSLAVGIFIAEGGLALAQPGLGIPGFSALGRWLTTMGLGDWFRIGHACHLGGALVGWLCARWTLRQRIGQQALRRKRLRKGS